MKALSQVGLQCVSSCLDRKLWYYKLYDKCWAIIMNGGIIKIVGWTLNSTPWKIYVSCLCSITLCSQHSRGWAGQKAVFKDSWLTNLALLNCRIGQTVWTRISIGVKRQIWQIQVGFLLLQDEAWSKVGLRWPISRDRMSSCQEVTSFNNLCSYVKWNV